jgi:2-hydroxy-3-oxopropionate reductase
MIERSNSPVVGFLGVGQIGRPMADRIIEKFETVICNRSPGKLDHFRGRAKIATTPRELASNCDIVFACLPTVQAYREASLGTDGVIAGNRAKIFVNVGTTGSPLVHELEAALGARGISLLDAPVTGGPTRAAQGDLVTMVAGAEDVLEQARAVIECYSSRCVYFGPRLGSAQTMKLVNNLVMIANLVLTTEAMVMGVKGGLDPEKMLSVLTGGTAQSYVISEVFPRHMVTRSFDFGGRLEMGVKDYDCVMEEARSLGAPVRVAEAAQRILLEAMIDQGPASDVTTIMRYLEKAAGTEFPQTRTASNAGATLAASDPKPE